MNTVTLPATKLERDCWFELGGTWYQIIDVTYNCVGRPVIEFHDPDLILRTVQVLTLHPTTLIKVRF